MMIFKSCGIKQYNFERRKWDEAIAVLSQIIELAPTDDKACHYCGNAYSEKGEYDLCDSGL